MATPSTHSPPPRTQGFRLTHLTDHLRATRASSYFYTPASSHLYTFPHSYFVPRSPNGHPVVPRSPKGHPLSSPFADSGQTLGLPSPHCRATSHFYTFKLCSSLAQRAPALVTLHYVPGKPQTVHHLRATRASSHLHTFPLFHLPTPAPLVLP